MSRIPKKYINTPFLHIMIQGNNKNFIFEKRADKNKYLKILKETKEEINVIILAYCVMGNHVHLLFFEKNIENIIKFMHKSNILYAKYYNKKYDRVGYVFRDRYKTQPIMSEDHLLTCINYIHNNPVKANICNRPEEYIYSSYNSNIYMGQSEIECNIKRYIEERKNYVSNSDFDLMEYEENDNMKICKDLINDFLLKNQITLQELKKNKDLASVIIIQLKDNYNFSNRTIEKYINISREGIRNIYLSYKNKK